MIVNPILPIWFMLVLCIGIIVLLRPKDKFKFFRQIVIIFLLFLVNLRIMIPGESETFAEDNNLDILFVVDSSISMVAEDYNGSKTRLSAIKKDCEKIINSFSGARFSVIVFDDVAKIMVPFTKDENIAIEVINSITVAEELYAKGSSMNSPIELIEEDFKKFDDNNRKKIIFFISDGEITSDETLKSYSELSKYIDNGAVLGYGTTTGGKMKVKTTYYDNTTSYLIDRSDWPYEEAVSKIDENNLKKIASDLNVDYINMSKQSNIDDKIKEVKNKYSSQSLKEDSSSSTYTDTYYVLTEIICFILVIEYINYKRRI